MFWFLQITVNIMTMHSIKSYLPRRYSEIQDEVVAIIAFLLGDHFRNFLATWTQSIPFTTLQVAFHESLLQLKYRPVSRKCRSYAAVVIPTMSLRPLSLIEIFNSLKFFSMPSAIYHWWRVKAFIAILNTVTEKFTDVVMRQLILK